MDSLRSLNNNLSVAKKRFNKLLKEKQEQLGALQRKIKEKNIPVIIVFEGWFTSGKGEIINSVIQGLDARGFKLHSGYSESADAKHKPFFWQYWYNLPEQGRFSLFEYSWYHKAMKKVMSKELSPFEPSLSYSDINSFEAHLIHDNYIIIKFFLHSSKKQLLKRYKNDQQLFESTLRAMNKFDRAELENYDKFMDAYEDMLRQTSSAIAPWFPIESDDLRYAQLTVFDTLIRLLSEKLNTSAPPSAMYVPTKANVSNIDHIAQLDLSKKLEKEIYKKNLEKYQERLRELQIQLLANKISLVVALEGSDAAGKGGTIRRLTRALDPRGYYVVPIAAPQGIEKYHNYMWRFWREMPLKGQIAIFDRTWYGRVLVERVEGFATEQEWNRAYPEINEFESLLIHDNMILVKFWLQIDKDEQLRRFNERQNTPDKNWKITPEDWRNREKWDDYRLAVRDMLAETNTSYAPWTIVEANCKYYARIKVLETVVKAIENKLSALSESKK